MVAGLVRMVMMIPRPLQVPVSSSPVFSVQLSLGLVVSDFAVPRLHYGLIPVDPQTPREVSGVV